MLKQTQYPFEKYCYNIKNFKFYELLELDKLKMCVSVILN